MGKKRAQKDLSDPHLDEVVESVQVEERKKKKKKDKEMYNVETENASSMDPKTSSDIGKEISKKKKKSKKRDRKENSDEDSGSENECVKAKKKKKKRSNKDGSSVEGEPKFHESSDSEEVSTKATKDSSLKKGKSENDINEKVKNKKRKTESEETSLGVVDTSILQQAVTNLGLPLGEETTPTEDVEEKKKKKKDKTPSTPKPQGDEGSYKEKALEYLKTWHVDRGNWKFNKHLQVKLLHMMYDNSLMTDETFALMLLYLEGLGGKGREKTKEEAGKFIAEDESETDPAIHPIKEERARQIFQLLS